MILPIIGVALASAQAVPVTAGSDRDYSVSSSRAEAERTLQLYADCLVKVRSMRPRIQQFLRTSPDTAEFSPRGMALVDASCAPKARNGYQLRINPGLMQTALYSALYRQQFGKAAADVSNRAPIDVAAEYDGPAASIPATTTLMRRLGDCVARRNQTAARSMILSRLGSDTEQAAITALVPDVQQCVDQGSTFRFSRTMLRGVTAEGLYKLSVAPVAPSSPTPQKNAG